MNFDKQIFSLVSQDLDELLDSAQSQFASLKKLKALAHKLKGSLGFLGDLEASQLCKNLESQIEELLAFLAYQTSNIKKIRDKMSLKIRL